jgi:ribosomal protein S18 acetylase RimI-like enzyme
MENKTDTFYCSKQKPKDDDIDTLLKSYNFGIMSFDANLMSKSKEKIKNLLKKSNNTFSVFDKKYLVGVCSIKKMEWDTNFFGYPCACIDFCFADNPNGKRTVYSIMMVNVKKWLLSNKIRFCYTKVDKRDNVLITSLKDIGFKIIEEVASFYINLKERDTTPTAGNFRMATAADIPRLQEISPQVSYDRFTKDKMFSDQEVKIYREEWIKNLVNGLSDFVILSVDNNMITGFNACNIERDTNSGIIKLIVVDKEYRGRGIGKGLVNTSIAKFKERGVDYLFVSTQSDNIPSHNLYTKCDFKKAPPMVTLHYWGEN